MTYVLGRTLLSSSFWAAVAALIFAVHPVNAEAVNYVVARSSLLAALGSAVALWAFDRRERGGGLPWLAGGLVAFAVALLSKESAISLALPLLAYGWLVGSRTADFRRVWDLAAFACVALAFLLLRHALVGATAMEAQVAAHPIMTFVELVARSLVLWIWPWPLGVMHPLTFASGFDPFLATGFVALGMGAVVVITATWRRAPVVAWVLVWVGAGFVPLAILPWITTKGLLQENRLVFSAIGMSWLTAISFRLLLTYLPERTLARGVALAAGIALILTAIALDRSRTMTWSDERLLWREAVSRDPSNGSAYSELGRAHRERGELDQAEKALTRALDLTPDYALAYFNLGAVKLERKQFDEARGLLQRGIDLAPGSWKAYHVLGEIELKSQRTPEAIAAFSSATALNPCDSHAHLRLGVIAQRAGDAQRAEISYRRVLECDPDQPEAFNNLAAISLERHEWLRAFDYATEALRRKPDFIDAAYNRAIARFKLGELAEARADLKAVLQQLPSREEFDPYRHAIEQILEGGQ